MYGINVNIESSNNETFTIEINNQWMAIGYPEKPDGWYKALFYKEIGKWVKQRVSRKS
jgi:hypothetical protein